MVGRGGEHPDFCCQLVGGLPKRLVLMLRYGRLPAAGRSEVAVRLQFPVEEIGCGLVGAQPGSVAEEAVNFIGDDQLFEVDALGA